MDFQTIVDGIGAAAAVISVEKLGEDNYGKVRIVTGNRPYIDTIERPMGGLEMLTVKFTPNSEYTDYLTRDLNFEDSCYQAAVGRKCLHAYAHPARYDVWFNMSFLPLGDGQGDICYCMYIMEVNFKPDAKRMSAISADIATAVLETCIKLRSPDDFRVTMKEVCEDIRDLCDSEHCCVLLMDTKRRKCSVLCEAFSKDTKLLPMDNYVDDAFYDIAESWKDTIAGSNCLIVKNEHDMEVVKERNPIWHDSITGAGGRSIVLFPLEFKGELLGYIWAINFSADVANTIKETLELTTFILASEIYSFQLMDELNILSKWDMLTGVLNRNAMNNRVDKIIADEAGGGSEKSVGIVFADLNGLKRVNDVEGHIAGDLLLKKAALLLQKVFHEKDFLGSEIYRAGGDEFMILIENVTEEALKRKAEELKAAAADPKGVCFAVGWSLNPIGEITRSMREADERMYADKQQFYRDHPELKRS